MSIVSLKVIIWFSLSYVSILEFCWGTEDNSRTWPVSLRVCVVCSFISDCPACGNRRGGNEDLPWGRSYSSSYTVSTNVADVGSAVPWHYSHFLPLILRQILISSSVTKFGFVDLANWRCQQRAPHGKQRQKICVNSTCIFLSPSVSLAGSGLE